MRKFSALVAAFALCANAAFAASVPQVTLQQSSLPGDLPDVNLAIANVNAAINPQSTAAFSNFRNYLDNGEFAPLLMPQTEDLTQDLMYNVFYSMLTNNLSIINPIALS